MKCLWVLAVIAGCCVRALGQGVGAPAVREFPAYRVYPGTLDENNFPVSGAKLCTTEAKPHCFTLTPQVAWFGKDEVRSFFGLRARSKRVKLGGGGSTVLFNANCGGGSGSDDRYVLLRSESDGHLKNLLPEIIVTNQADVAVWDLPTVSPVPLMLTADALWEDGQTEPTSSTAYFDPALDRHLRSVDNLVEGKHR